MKAGDTVYAVRHGFCGWGLIGAMKGTVKRITPTGRIVVSCKGSNVTFRPDGREAGDNPHHWRMCDEQEYHRAVHVIRSKKEKVAAE